MHRATPLLLLLCLGLSLPLAAVDDFVAIKGGMLRPGIRLDDFELLARPITNADYKRFIDDAKYAPPPSGPTAASPPVSKITPLFS